MQVSNFTKKKREKFTTMLHPDIRDEVKKLAIDEKKSVADIIEVLLEDYLADKMKKSINKD